jgi:hypothetical protein
MNNSTEKTPKMAGTIHEIIHAKTQYRLITANEEFIQRTGEQIVRACQLEINNSAWQQNFSLAVQHVIKWCKEHKVLLGLVDLRSDKIVFYFVPKGDQFDFDLSQQQADLDIFLNTRSEIGYTETRQVPQWELDRFVSERALRFWPIE